MTSATSGVANNNAVRPVHSQAEPGSNNHAKIANAMRLGMRKMMRPLPWWKPSVALTRWKT
jgi:hypothetical protein